MTTKSFINRTRWLQTAICTLILLFTLGVGNAWGEDEVIYTLTPVAGSDNSYAGDEDIACEDEDNDLTITWNVTGNATMIPWRIGGKGGSKSSSTATLVRDIYCTSALSTDDVSKVILSHGTSTITGSGWSINSVTLIVSTSSDGGGTVISSIERAFKEGDTIIINRPAGKDWSSRYFTIRYNISAKGTSNKYLEFSGAEFYAEAVAVDPYTVSFNTGTGNPTQADITEASGGAGITLPSVTPTCSGDGWALYGWATSACSSETGIAPEIVGAASATYHPTSNTTLHAVYRKSLATNGFFKMTALSQLTADDTYIIVAQYSTRNYVMTNSYSTSGDYGRLAGSQINETSSGFYSAASIASGYRFTITGSEDNYYIYNSTDSKYVDTGYKTFYVTKKDGDDPWSITVTDGVWTFANAYDGYLGYTGSSNIFESFDSADDLLLYKYSTYSYYSSPSCCTPLGTINGSFSRTIFHRIYAFL